MVMRLTAILPVGLSTSTSATAATMAPARSVIAMPRPASLGPAEEGAGEAACRLSRRAQVTSTQRDRPRRLPGQVLSGDLLVRELIHLARRSSSIGKPWVRRLEAHLPGSKQDAPGIGPREAAVQVIPHNDFALTIHAGSDRNEMRWPFG